MNKNGGSFSFALPPFFMGASKLMVSSIFYLRHPERSEGSSDRDFSPTAQNDEFRRYALCHNNSFPTATASST
ncbi:MAG: hypothetical protein IJ566_03020 [Cardiobacteriaceae bacterium]|nr:hypothetical protein [Cardiobacteriaceae bacterium]